MMASDIHYLRLLPSAHMEPKSVQDVRLLSSDVHRVMGHSGTLKKLSLEGETDPRGSSVPKGTGVDYISHHLGSLR
jgi:hypothetical protein